MSVKILPFKIDTKMAIKPSNDYPVDCGGAVSMNCLGCEYMDECEEHVSTILQSANVYFTTDALNFLLDINAIDTFLEHVKSKRLIGYMDKNFVKHIYLTELID
ncbi:TPA: hypothetical protein ACGVB5_004723 [Vibrio vulnificus]|nr:hypothetical protein [Vibrio vulnificus]HDY8021260.1 hypothetical protein [Vibrio vulnificus]HDY8043818.1 hypothetical protein [Vibrio vulnificus]